VDRVGWGKIREEQKYRVLKNNWPTLAGEKVKKSGDEINDKGRKTRKILDKGLQAACGDVCQKSGGYQVWRV